jgi:hypothetical protein
MTLTFDRSSRRRLLGAFAFIGLVTAAACGGGSDVASGGDLCDGKDCGASCESPSDCDAGLFCNDGKCSSSSGYECTAAKCGDACDASSDCGAGLYCGSDDKCTAQCATSAQCASGQTCTANGRCIEGPDFGTGGNGNGGEGGGSSCIDIDVTFKPQTPTVMLLVDRSGSMNAPDDTFAGAPAWDCDPDDADWRWNVARYVLLHPTEGVVKPLEDKVRFGQVLYSGHEDETCPDLAGVVPPALNNHASMLDEFQCNDIYNDTPTKEALEAVVDQLAAFDEPGPKVIVLATDGEPDSCEYYDWDNDDYWDELGIADQAEADQIGDDIKQSVVDEAAAAKALGITVNVIHIAENNGALWTHVQNVAEAGGGNAYQAFDIDALKGAFSSIVNGSRNCIIDLDGSIAEGKESEGSIVLNGEKLELDDPNGWKMNTASQIELLGDACETIKSEDDPMLSIKFPCEGFVPDIIK